ncbi:MAG TPA: hypothetical protein VMM56_10145 [Planctomycetaceae bacterium]|nr:hypothetical protein [Planctomycetaceae bacterium]
MNSDFAGSSSHDDRRRRRLLSEQNVSDENAAVVFVPGQIESSRNHRYPVKRIIHYRVWKLWVISLLLVLLGGGFLYGAWLERQHDLGQGFSLVFNAETGRIFPVASAALLFLSGQLSWLIGWARSRSLTDYGGRFRVWRYIGLFLFAVSFGVLIGADRVLNQTLAHVNARMPWNELSWNWIIPTSGVSLILLWFCDREMRRSKLGRTHLWIAVGLLAGGLGPQFFSQLNTPILIEQGLVLGGHISLLMSLMWFARHVCYVSAEPALGAQHAGVLSRILGYLKRRRIQNATAAAEKKTAHSNRDKATRRKPSAAPPSTPPRRRGVRKKSETVEAKRPETPDNDWRSQADESPQEEVEEVQVVKLDAAEISASSVDEEVLRERIEMMELLAADGEPFDLEILKGLTKKQKKRLRNYWRDLERTHQIRRAG